MPLEDPDRARLWDMLNHAREVQEMCRGVPLAEYERDKKLRWAVERCIEIIGEAARNVSRPVQAQHPEIPWQKIVAQRHVLAHEYGDIKQSLIYRIVTFRLPELEASIEAILDEETPD